MATVLEECTTEEQRSVMSFIRAKGLNVKDINKEMFYVAKSLSRNAVYNWVEERGKYFADEAVETEVQKWLKQV
jgi:hypothetical protein